MRNVREILKKRPLLFDGGMGTYYKSKPGQSGGAHRARLGWQRRQF